MPRPEFELATNIIHEALFDATKSRSERKEDSRKKLAEVLENLFPAEKIEKTKKDAKKWWEDFFGEKKEKRKEMRRRLKEDAYKPKSPEKANQMRLEAEATVDIAGRTKPDWIPDRARRTSQEDPFPNPVVSEFYARITVLPEELKNDPNVLYSELVRANYSFDYRSATDEDVRQFRDLLDRTLDRVQDLREQSSQSGVPRVQLERQLAGRADIYRTKRIDKKDPARPTQVERDFEDRLRKAQTEIDAARTDEEETRILKGLKKNLVEELNVDQGNRMEEEIIGSYINQIDDQLDILEPEAEQKQKADRKIDNRRSQEDEDQELSATWLTDGLPTLENEELNTLLEEIQNNIDLNNRNSVQEAQKKLEDLVRQTAAEENGLQDTDIQPYLSRIRSAYARANSTESRYRLPSPEDLLDPVKRDIEFYSLLQGLIDQPNEESREVINFNNQTEIDRLIEAIRKSDPKDGSRLAKWYSQRKNAIIRAHDLDLQARLVNDPEKFVGAMKFFPSEYLVDAMSDPIVESFYRIYEQTLLSIRDNNGGLIPPNLVAIDPGATESEWDRMAYEMFIDQVEKGLIFDVPRDPISGALLANTKPGERGKKITIEDIKNQELKIKASMRMAKGVGVATMRYLEIFATAKSPGLARKQYEIARYMNPIEDLFIKFTMGGEMHAPFFYSLLGVEGNDIANYFKFNPKRWIEIAQAVKDGRYEDYMSDIEEIYKQNGKPVPKNIRDMASKFRFSGGFGPASDWRENNATIGWDERDKERMGTSMRLKRAKQWAKNHDHGHSHDAHHGHEGPLPGEQAYKVYVWTQAAMRNPLLIASTAEVSDQFGKSKKVKLRNQIIETVLGIQLPTEPASSETTYVAELGSEAKLKIQTLEQDVYAIQQKAMIGGEDGRPRNILLSDFDVIPDETRRNQAIQYWQEVQKKFLGLSGEHADREIFNMIGVSLVNHGGKFELEMAHPENVRAVFDRGGLLTDSFLEKDSGIYDGMTDVQWQYFNLQKPGPSVISSRAGEFGGRTKTIDLMVQYLTLLKGKITHQDEAEMIKTLAAISATETGATGPDSARMFVYYWTRATDEVYRQRVWGAVPVAGKILGGTGIMPMSIAQVLGGKDATYWSANNVYHFNHEVANAAKLPHHHHGPNGEVYEYNLHGLNQEVSATPRVATAEAIIIGGSLVGLGTTGLAIYSGIQQAEEEPKGSSSHSPHGGGH